MLTETAKRRQAKTRVMSNEARARYNAYQRDYRRRNPDKTRRWRDAYIIRRAARLAAEQAGGDAS